MHLINAIAHCTECPWKTEGKNAMGNAAKHYHKRLHHIQVELFYIHEYGHPPKPQLQEMILQPEPIQEQL